MNSILERLQSILEFASLILERVLALAFASFLKQLLALFYSGC